MPKLLSDPAKDFINRALARNRVQRLRLADMLEHPWIQSAEVCRLRIWGATMHFHIKHTRADQCWPNATQIITGPLRLHSNTTPTLRACLPQIRMPAAFIVSLCPFSSATPAPFSVQIFATPPPPPRVPHWCP